MDHPRFNSVRRALGRLIEGLTVTVQHGPLQGRKLSLDSRRDFRRGTYEPEESSLFVDAVRPGWVVYDMGAHLGYYALLASTLVGETGRVVCFEPMPQNLRRLYRHLAINHCDNVEVVEACVGERAGVARFTKGYTSRSGRITNDGELEFPVVGVDELVEAEALPPPDLIKMDVEGAESRVLRGMSRLLARRPPMLFLSVHENPTQREPCLELLTGFGYQFTALGNLPLSAAHDYVATPGDWQPSQDR